MVRKRLSGELRNVHKNLDCLNHAKWHIKSRVSYVSWGLSRCSYTWLSRVTAELVRNERNPGTWQINAGNRWWEQFEDEPSCLGYKAIFKFILPPWREKSHLLTYLIVLS